MEQFATLVKTKDNKPLRYLGADGYHHASDGRH
jgi:hypothetical protein